MRTKMAVMIAMGICLAYPQSVSWEGNSATITWPETLAVAGVADSVVPFTVITGPYVAWQTDTGAIIGWEVVASRSLTLNPIRFNPNPPLNLFEFRSCTLSGLTPNTEYRYKLRSTNGRYLYQGGEYVFKTLPSRSAKTLRFALIGDTQFGSAITGTLSRSIKAWNPDLLVHVGDIVGMGQGYTMDRKLEWLRVFEHMKEARASLFMAAVSGNHDCRRWLPDDGTLFNENYLWMPGYFRDYQVQSNAKGASQPPFYHSFDAGNVHFVGIHSEIDTSMVYERFTMSQMAAWVDEDLKNSAAQWKIAYFHHPFTSNIFNAVFKPIFMKYGVQLVLTGHDHVYARTTRLNANRVPSDTGFMLVVSGGGSSSQACIGGTVATAEFCKQASHYVRLEVSEDSINGCAVDVGDTVFDAWTLPLIGQPRVKTGGMAAANERTSKKGAALAISPNPFNPGTRIGVTVPFDAGRATLDLYDINGRKIRTWSLRPGESSLIWDGTDSRGLKTAAGLYTGILTIGAGARTVVCLTLTK